MKQKITDKQKLLFIGDSITDCSRRDAAMPLGNGYVKTISDLLIIRRPKISLNIINKGVSGDTVVQLRNRWEDDVVAQKPDCLFIKVGINDIHSVAREEPNAVTPEKFSNYYDEILSATKKKLSNCHIVLVDPFFLSTDSSCNSFRGKILKLLPEYLNVICKMSKCYKTRVIHIHEVFQKLLQYHCPDTFGKEPVHPNVIGHLVIAEEIYKFLDKNIMAK